ncbi:MAG: CoA-binding protein [Bacteroidales bacterium]|nr:CoA-binding protein [Bacteroidales bacterium]
MINDKLLKPGTIAVVGGSEAISKTGGKVLYNLIKGGYKGHLYVVNPKAQVIQGIKSYPDVSFLPSCDLAILAIPAKMCLQAVTVLAREKNTGAFIILSAGFGEESGEGREAEQKIASVISSVGGTLIGPNCIGFLNMNYAGVFTTPLPVLRPDGIELISGSGATAVFIMEAAVTNGVPFSAVWSVGNSAQTGIEDVLEYLDESYTPGSSSRVKLLYIESIRNPGKLLKHSVSLITKGCRIAALKAGVSEAGIRAASSHTGAMASPDMAYDALLRKAGIIRCHSRSELVAVASVFLHRKPAGKRVGIVTHAGGPAVILTDILSKNGLEVPQITGPAAEKLKEKLHPGSSVANPVDFLATGTAEQLGLILDACDNDFSNIDSVAVIFGSPGLFSVKNVYSLLQEKMKNCRKPVYAILPSLINARNEMDEFAADGNIYFTDEAIFGKALAAVLNQPQPETGAGNSVRVDHKSIRSVIDSAAGGYLEPEDADKLLDAAGIPRPFTVYVTDVKDMESALEAIGFPVAMKAVGPLHKTDAGGVVLNVSDIDKARETFSRLMAIKECRKVLIQKMTPGTELFAGVKYETGFGHLLLAGLGGIFVEVLKDFKCSLIPVGINTAKDMIRSLKGYGIIKGARGQSGVSEELFAELICRLSALTEAAPEIRELDLNPLMGNSEKIVAVDARIRIEKRIPER